MSNRRKRRYSDKKVNICKSASVAAGVSFVMLLIALLSIYLSAKGLGQTPAFAAALSVIALAVSIYCFVFIIKKTRGEGYDTVATMISIVVAALPVILLTILYIMGFFI